MNCPTLCKQCVSTMIRCKWNIWMNQRIQCLRSARRKKVLPNSLAFNQGIIFFPWNWMHSAATGTVLIIYKTSVGRTNRWRFKCMVHYAFVCLFEITYFFKDLFICVSAGEVHSTNWLWLRSDAFTKNIPFCWCDEVKVFTVSAL